MVLPHGGRQHNRGSSASLFTMPQAFPIGNACIAACACHPAATLMQPGPADKLDPRQNSSIDQFLCFQRNEMPEPSRRVFLTMGLAAAITPAAGPAYAVDTVRLGKAVPNSFAFSTAEIGTDAKIWPQE